MEEGLASLAGKEARHGGGPASLPGKAHAMLGALREMTPRPARGRREGARLALAALALACSRPPERDYRGTSTPSADGGTRLIVVVSGSACTPVLDETPWPHPTGVAGDVTPGSHSMKCAGETSGQSFVTHAGATFRFEVLRR